jgi:GT2 family glycosyltransferase
MSAAPAVAIVLVTYYGTKNLDTLHTSLLAQRYPIGRSRLIVVENGPDRAAARWFADHAPEARVLCPGANTGYAGGNALGMQEALAAGVDYVAVVTQDTWLDAGWLGALVDVAETHPRAGAVQPKILRRDAEGRSVIHSRGNELHFLGIGYVGGDGEPDRALELRRIPYASGAGALYRSAALRDVGIFDSTLFMYHEDADLGWRLWLAGWEVLFAPGAVMHHEYVFARGGEKFYWVERNRLANVLTHYRAATLGLLAPALLLFEPVAVVFAHRSGWLRQRLAVYAWLARPATWRYLAAKRRAVQRLRRVPDRAIVPLLSGRFRFAPIANQLVRRGLDPVLAAYWAVVRRLIAW